MKKYLSLLILLIAVVAYATPPSPPFSTNITGNAATATSLAANGANCNAGYAPLGVDASGAVESCTQYQAYDADLTTWAGITPSANVQTFVSSADYATARTNLGLGTIATQNADAVAITAGNVTGLTNLGASNVTITGGTASGMTSVGTTTLKADHIQENTTSHGIVFDNAVTGTKVDWAKPANIADSATPAIGAALGNAVDLDGTTTITAFDTVAAGVTRFVSFTGVRTITHNGTSLILPGARNILTAAGDRATFISLGSGNWRCHEYLKSSGIAVGTLDEQIVSASASLTRNQMFGGQINTFGQANDETITLLPIEKGMNFCVVVGTTVAKYVRVDPDNSDSIYDGTTTAGDGKYFGVASAAVGQKICFEAFQTGANAYDWSVSYLGPWLSE